MSLDIENPKEQRELKRFDAEPAFHDCADAELLALVATRPELLLATDDLAATNRARKVAGAQRVASTLDLLVIAIREERLSVAQAESLLPTLDIGPALERRMDVSGVRLQALV